MLSRIRCQYSSACSSNSGTAPWWMLILGYFNFPDVYWLTRSCSMANSSSYKLLTAADEEFLHQTVTSPTRYRTGQLPSILDLVFSRYSSSIHSINHLAPLNKSDYVTLQVNFAASDLPAGNIFKPKWRYNKANVQGLLCAVNSIDWASISQMAHVNDQRYHIKKSILLLQDRFVPGTGHDNILKWNSSEDTAGNCVTL